MGPGVTSAKIMAVGETSELHSRSALAERARLTEKPKIPQSLTGIESIRSKLAFKIFDEYANILKGMYSRRFNGITADGETPTREPSAQGGPAPPLITSLSSWEPNKFGRQKAG